MIAGIILHPVKVVYHLFYRSNDEWSIQRRILLNWKNKNYERMHNFGPLYFPNASTYTYSELYENGYKGALDRIDA